MSRNTAIAVGIVLVLACLGSLVGINIISYPGQVTTAENGIQGQNAVCLQGLSTSFDIIKGQAQVDARFDASMKDLFTAILTASDATKQQTANQQFFALVSANQAAGATNFGQTKVILEQTIAAELTKFANCMGVIADRERELRNLLGLAAGQVPGQAGTFPNAWFASIWHMPHDLQVGAPNSPVKDLDGDGRITALDYPTTVVNAGIREDFNNGVSPDVNVYGTPTPAK